MSDQEPAARPPVLVVFAGPNGAGKSTLFDRYQDQAGPGLEQVNGDVLKAKYPHLSGYEVDEMTVARIKELRTERVSYSVESNLAKAEDYKLIHGAKADGYEVRLVYVGLDSPEKCQDRVASRVAQGGHDVPPAIVEQRYHQSLSLLKQNYKHLDRIELVDNSKENYQLHALIERGRVAPLQSEPPAWVQGVVSHVQRLERINELLAQPATTVQQATIRVTEQTPAPGTRSQAESVQAAVRVSGAQVSDVQPASAAPDGNRVSYLTVQYDLKSPQLEQISRTLDAVSRQPGSEVLESKKEQAQRQALGQAREVGADRGAARGQDQGQER